MSRKTLFEFVRERIVPINAVFVFSGGLVMALDFVAPKGAYLQAVGIGLASLFVLLMIVDLVFHDAVQRWLDRPTIGLMRLVKGLWMGQSQIWKSAVWQFAIAISVLIVGLGAYSKAKAETGGILASQFESVAALQRNLLGIQMDLQDIKQTLANVKQETSSDPRKELVNLGIQFTENDFDKAVAQNDVRALALFVQARITLNERKLTVVRRALETNNEQVIQLVQELVPPLTLDGCRAILDSRSMYLDKPTTSSKTRFFQKICGGQDFQNYLSALIQAEEKRIRAEQQALNQWQNRTQAEKHEAEQLEKQCWEKAKKTASTLFSAPDCGRYTNPPSKPDDQTLLEFKKISMWLG